MKTIYLPKMVAALVATGLTLSAPTVPAQNASASNPSQPAAVNAPVPPLSYGTSQILRLARANVGEETIIAYIRSSGNSYGLDASQIIYLRQQGVSDAVITTMLSQPNPTAGVAAPATPAPQPVAAASGPAPVPATTVAPAVAPTVTYVQTAPAPVYYYYQPYYYPCYPSYGVYPALSLSFAWGSGGSGGHGGGYYGGGHGGGWHH